MIISRSAVIYGLLFFCLLGYGCKEGTPPPPVKEAAPIDKKESLEDKVKGLQRELLRLRFKIDDLTSGNAYVSTEEKGYAIAQTKFGSFAMICENATQYLDGYKVRLRVGNLTNARFNGAKIELQWGESLDSSKEVSVTNTFLPGRYTTVELVLTPAKPEDIKTFSVTLKFDQMALMQ